MSKTDKKKFLPTVPVSKFSSSPTKLPTTTIDNANAVFSFEKFKCISIKNKEFNNCFKNMWEYAEWSLKLIDRLSKFSTMKALELKSSGKSVRCHPVTGVNLLKLKSVLEASGVELNEQLEDCDYYELSLGASDGRIFGYFIGSVYYVLLFDPHHLIYQQLQYGSQQDLLYRNCDPWERIS